MMAGMNEIRDGEMTDREASGDVGLVWSKPEIVSYKPASAAQGISYLPNDGISNLTP
jgi:hypothetical protein